MILESPPQLQEQLDALRADVQRLRDQLAGAVGLPSPGTNGQMLYTNAALPYWGNPPTSVSLAAANTWTGIQTFGSTSTYTFTLNATYVASAQVPASTSTWYRIATIAHTDYGQEATIFVRTHRLSGAGEALYKFVIGKATYDAVLGTSFEYRLPGRYNTAYGISQARIVDSGVNGASYLDVKFKTTDAYDINLACDTRAAGAASVATLGFASQGTGAAGTSFACDTNVEVKGNTTYGVSSAIDNTGKVTLYKDVYTLATTHNTSGVYTTGQFYSTGAGAGFTVEDRATFVQWAMYATGGVFSFWNSVNGNTFSVSQAGTLTISSITLSGTLSLPGTTLQYVRGDGSLATFPGGGVSSVSAGNGMSFSTITGSGSVTMGTPSTCTAATSNATTSTSHTHAISGFMPTTGGTFSGAITAPGVTDSSDIRFKRDVRTIRDGLDIIRSLRPVRFFNTLTEQNEVGFVAQDVRGVLPEVVSTDDNGDLAVAYQRIIAPVVAAMQAIDARLSAIEAR